MELEVLKRFRDNEKPAEITVIEDKPLSILKREELIELAERRGVSVLEISRLGGLDPCHENLVVLVHYVICVAKEKNKRPAQEQHQEVVNKKKKGAMETSMEELRQEVKELKKQLEGKQSESLQTEFDRARADAKLEASKREADYKPSKWEQQFLPFNPLVIEKRKVSFVTYQGNPYAEKNALSAEKVYELATLGSGDEFNISHLKFPDPDAFVSGSVNSKLLEWKLILRNEEGNMCIKWLEQGIRIHDFIKPFDGKFWGQSYNSDFPAARQFPNSNKCKHHIDFINNTISERLQNGSIFCKGKVGECEPPFIVSPLTVERSKPRLCLNLMYLNNWIKDIHFTLDTLKDIPRLINKGAYFTSLDDKSGFDNVHLHPDSCDLVGFQWAGYYFCFKTLPFGFKLSSYIYHTLNLQVASYIRQNFAIPIFLYIDDRLIEEVRNINLSSEKSALLANYITCEVLVRLGYFINLQKSCFRATQTPVHLGFIVDSIEECFRVTDDKKKKIIQLREELLQKRSLTVTQLQKFAGKAISLMIAVPAAKLYTREINLAISKGIISQSYVKMYDELYEELLSWRFIDTWSGKLCWKNEKHITIKLFTDSSKYKYGGVINWRDGQEFISDFWKDNERSYDIMVLEGYALLNVLGSVATKIQGKRVDAYIDNMVLLNAWENEGCRSRDMNVLIKKMFSFVLNSDIILKLHYVPSKDNIADKPSRELKKSDSMLSKNSWKLVQNVFGGKNGHSIDLMALDSNCMLTKNGKIMKHFTPWPTPLSAGVNMFEQNVGPMENSYVFPAFHLVTPVLKFILELNLICTVIIPMSNVTPIWLPSIFPGILDCFLLGLKGQTGVIMVPTKKGFLLDKRGLSTNLWAIRIGPSSIRHNVMSYGKLMLQRNPGVGPCFHFLCVGDSMIRFLRTSQYFMSPMIHIHSVSGGLISCIHNELKTLITEYPPSTVLIHVGVNNLSKCYLYPDQFTQIQVALKEYDELIELLKNHCTRVNVILSSIACTKDGFINARASVVNKHIRQACEQYCWTYLDNSNVERSELKDTVHFNVRGEVKFKDRLLIVLRKLLS